MSQLEKAKEWVLAGGVNLKQDGDEWTLLVDKAVDKFDVDVEQLDAALCASLSIAKPPDSNLRPSMTFSDGLLTISQPTSPVFGAPKKAISDDPGDPENIGHREFDLIDHLAMLLSAVAKASAKSGIESAAEVIATDEFAQAHFHVFSAELKQATGIAGALVEYGPADGRMHKMITSALENPAGWSTYQTLA